MALARVHTTAADGTFSAAGAIAWNAAHGVTGADVGGIPYCPTATTEATSSALTFNGTTLSIASINAANTAVNTDLALSARTSHTGTAGRVIITGASNVTGGKLLSVVRAGDASDHFYFDNGGTFYAIGGFYASSASGFFNANDIVRFSGNAGLQQSSGSNVSWSSNASNYSSGVDTNLSRIGAGVIGAGTGAVGSVAGTFRGLYQSSDGTAGITFAAQAVTSITVKDGLIVAKAP